MGDNYQLNYEPVTRLPSSPTSLPNTLHESPKPEAEVENLEPTFGRQAYLPAGPDQLIP